IVHLVVPRTNATSFLSGDGHRRADDAGGIGRTSMDRLSRGRLSCPVLTRLSGSQRNEFQVDAAEPNYVIRFQLTRSYRQSVYPRAAGALDILNHVRRAGARQDGVLS